MLVSMDGYGWSIDTRQLGRTLRAAVLTTVVGLGSLFVMSVDATSQAATSDGVASAVAEETIFFAGPGMEGDYVQGIVHALEKVGVRNPRAVDPRIWSDGFLLDSWQAFSDREPNSKIENLVEGVAEGGTINLVGYSSGGIKAMQAALDHAARGDKVKMLVLIAAPISTKAMQALVDEPNIGRVVMLHLHRQGDQLHAGMDWPEIVQALPRLGYQFLTGQITHKQRGHYYLMDGHNAKWRWKVLAKKLNELGVE